MKQPAGHNKLDSIEERELEKRARKSRWSIEKFAEDLGISRRTLERWFEKKMAISPRRWMARLRLADMQDLRRAAYSIKQIARLKHYSGGPQISRAYKRLYGFAPTSARPPGASLSLTPRL